MVDWEGRETLELHRVERRLSDKASHSPFSPFVIAALEREQGERMQGAGKEKK